MIKIVRGLSLVLLPMVMAVSGNATELKRDGWNLISVCADMNRNEINMNGIEEIQNQNGLTIYTGEFAFASNLETLEAGYGYWVKTTKIGTQFDSGEARRKLEKPLKRQGWNLMASCEDIAKEDINMSGIQEIQNQDGDTIYTGEFASASNLNVLASGYGHWVKGTHAGVLFTAKQGLSIPSGFEYQTINNKGEIVETSYQNYRVKLYSNYQETADAQKNHVGIVVNIDGENLPVLQVQDSYRGQEIVVAVFDQSNTLVGVSNNAVIDSTKSISIITLTLGNDTVITPINKQLLGSIIKGPIDGADITLYDDKNNSVAVATSTLGKFELFFTELNASYYVLESQGGLYKDESTETNITVPSTVGLRTLFTKNELLSMVYNKEFVAMTPETTIYTSLILEYLKSNSLEMAMEKAEETIYNLMIKDTSPLTILPGDKFLKKGDFTLATPKNQSEAFARNRAISFSNLMKNYNLAPERVFEIIGKMSQDYKDGSADFISIDGEDVNITAGYAQARKDLFNKTTGGGNTGGGNMGNGGENNNSGGTFDGNITKYSHSLAIPALAKYNMINGYKVFNLDINESTTEFFSGIQTKTYGINSHVLGQTIRMHRGDAVKLVYHNNLNEATTMHGHGMHVPAIMDGGPINSIQPNTTWTAEYTVDQKACTNWYHPHFMHKTAEHVYMGLAGFIIIDDDESDALDLPKEYGVDDIPLALQDKRFDAKGQIDYSPTTMEVRMGYLSEVMLANGVINPYVNVPAKKVRFRVLNGSNARVYKLEFSDGRSFTQIGTDNSFLEAPVELTSLVLTPSERADIVVDFKDDLNGSVILTDANSNLEIMKINVNRASTVQNPLPSVLTTHVKYDPTNAVRTRKFTLGMSRGTDGQMHMSINGKTMDMTRMDEVVPVDEIEVWEITNSMNLEHSFHMHATHFYPLERNGSPENITSSEQGYKDVIRLAPRDTVKIIVKMTDFTDDDTGYMYHCHFLEHEDDGMMGQFAVTTGEAIVNVDGTSGGMGGNQGNGNNQGNGGNNMGGNQGNGNNQGNGGNNMGGNQI